MRRLHWGVYAALLAERLSGGMIQGAAEGEGWPLWMNAMVFGFVSAISLPIGAVCGVIFSPVPQAVVAGWLAFGAGCLLFAVTVELYGEALNELEHDGYAEGSYEIVVTVCFAIIGAWGYIMINRWMEKVMSSPSHPAGPGSDVVEDSKDPKAGAKPHFMAKKLQAAAQRTQTKSLAGAATIAKKELISEDKLQKARGRNKALLRALHDHHEEEQDATAPAKQEASESKEGEGGKKDGKGHGFMLAMAMWLGVLVDGIPESILLGFLAAERRLSIALVISLFIANFPESFSSGSLMKEAGIPTWKITAMWTSLFCMTGCLAGFACWCLPQDGKGFHSGDNFWLHIFGAAIEGLAGGAMLACIASVMLPEAFEMRGDIIGLLCVIGFLTTVLIKVFGGYASEITGGREKTAPIHHAGKELAADHAAHGHHFLAPF